MSAERVSAMPIGRGLYALRYVSAPSPQDYPVADVRAAAGSEHLVSLITAPGEDVGALARPGSGVVLLVREAATIEVGVARRTPGGSLDAVLRLEPVSVGPQALADVEPPVEVEIAPPRSAAEIVDEFSLLAHVARRGDVMANSGQWAAGPAGPAAIEGVALVPSEGAWLPVDIQGRVGGPDGGWTEWAPAGVFVGTRGEALPLVAIRARVAESAPGDFEIAAEALFLGSPTVTKRGRLIEAAGAFETDPLVGLRVWVERIAGRKASTASAASALEKRLRVYRPSTARSAVG